MLLDVLLNVLVLRLEKKVSTESRTVNQGKRTIACDDDLNCEFYEPVVSA